MKNKLVTKIILVVVCVSTLLVTFVVPSFAYTWGNTSAYHNSVDQFTLPTTMLVLENVNSSVTDVPGYFYCPTSDYYGRGDRVISSVDCVIDDNDVNFALLNSVTASNVYENNGFVHGGDIKFKTFSNQVNFNTIYDLAGFRVEDYWFDTSLGSSAESSIYFSTTVSLPNGDWFYQLDPDTFDYVHSVPVRYNFEYYDYDGVYHQTAFFTKYFPDANNSVMIPYFPYVTYPFIGDDVGNDHPMRVEYIHFYDDIAYLDVLDISIMRDLCVPNFLVSSTETNIDCKGSYISRLLHPNYLGESFESILTNYTQVQYDEGYDKGYKKGYGIGKDEGFTEGSLNPASPFDGIMTSVTHFLDWEFIPGISVSVILSITIGVSLLIAFLKIFAGG